MVQYASILVLLFVFSFFDVVHSVCTICFDNAQPAGHATGDCPFTTVVAANAAAVAGAALAVTQLLGVKLSNFLTKPVLDRISNLRLKADPYTPYDCTDKTSAQITKAVGNGLLSLADAAATTTRVTYYDVASRFYITTTGTQDGSGSYDVTSAWKVTFSLCAQRGHSEFSRAQVSCGIVRALFFFH